MTYAWLSSLAVQSITTPRVAARTLLDLRLTREALATSFALVIVLNVLIFSLSTVLMPPAAEVPSVLSDPFSFMGLLAMSLAAMIVSLTLVGRGLGGTARFEDIAVLVIWMQALRVLVQAALLVVLPMAPFVGGLVMMASFAIGVWMLVHFLNVAHGLDNPFRAVMVLIFGMLAMALVVSVLLALLGFNPNGMSYV